MRASDISSLRNNYSVLGNRKKDLSTMTPSTLLMPFHIVFQKLKEPVYGALNF